MCKLLCRESKTQPVSFVTNMLLPAYWQTLQEMFCLFKIIVDRISRRLINARQASTSLSVYSMRILIWYIHKHVSQQRLQIASGDWFSLSQKFGEILRSQSIIEPTILGQWSLYEPAHFHSYSTIWNKWYRNLTRCRPRNREIHRK